MILCQAIEAVVTTGMHSPLQEWELALNAFPAIFTGRLCTIYFRYRIVQYLLVIVLLASHVCIFVFAALVITHASRESLCRTYFPL